MKKLIILLFLSSAFYSLNIVAQKVGGPCDGCEAIYEYGDRELSSEITMPLYDKCESKLRLTGKVFQSDGVTPAPNVVLYIYHTNEDGIYEKRGNEKGFGKRHGFIRGWLKTDSDGCYVINTFRPGAYPDLEGPAHIHVTVKEPGMNEYYISDFLFDDDPLLTPKHRSREKNRGGSGIVTLEKLDEIWVAQRDIVLGLNIPDYP